MDEQDIPIDISTNKLLDWLISRRHINKDWQSNVLKVREKINNAIQDMPEHKDIVNLLSGQHINYFHCLKIIEILKETEADSKNLFGRYGSQRMKDWQEIVQLYQRDNIYLAEAAQILIRNVTYEVPGLRKQVAKLEQTRSEYEKKIKDFAKVENLALSEFGSLCKQLGIKGDKIKKELIALLDDLPKIYKVSVENIKTVLSAVEVYSAFTKFNSGRESEVLPLLRYLIKHGNTTTYEYTFGEKPVTVIEPPLDIVDDDNENKNDGIDYGDIDFGDNGNEINSRDISPESVNVVSSEGDIDWGSLNTDEEFEIVDHIDLDVNLEESGIVVEKTGADGGIAQDSDAYTILDNPKTRNAILIDLMELEAFLKIRLYEMSTESDLLSLSQLDVPTILQMQTVESITLMFNCVQVALNDLTNKRTQHLHNIKHSVKYVDILSASLKQKLDLVDRMKKSQGVVEENIKTTQEEIKNITPLIEKVIERTKLLQKQLEGEVSKKYKGRQVNIVGGINMM